MYVLKIIGIVIGILVGVFMLFLLYSLIQTIRDSIRLNKITKNCLSNLDDLFDEVVENEFKVAFKKGIPIDSNLVAFDALMVLKPNITALSFAIFFGRFKNNPQWYQGYFSELPKKINDVCNVTNYERYTEDEEMEVLEFVRGILLSEINEKLEKIDKKRGKKLQNSQMTVVS